MARQEKHLLPHEVRIWRRFAASPPFPLDEVLFDLHLGQGIPVSPDLPIPLQEMATTLTQKRVDVVVRSGAEVWILEIKRRAGLSALGQCLGYADLFMQQFQTSVPPRLAVVAESVMYDVDQVLLNHGISVFLV